MNVRDVYEYINGFAPFDSQADWDNSGLLVGGFSSEINCAVICLDVTSDVIDFAVKEKAQLIISHHPVIFRPQKNFLCGNVAYNAAVNGISIICAHTNLDKAPDGVNDMLCKALELDFVKSDSTVCDGFLNIGSFRRAMNASEAALYIKSRLQTAVSFVDGGSNISKVGICSGSGASFIDEAVRLGCNAFITGEASYHEYLDAAASGVSLFSAGHYETEVVVIRTLAEKLRQKFNEAVFLEYAPGNIVMTEK